jgi:hypothetical protein
MTQKAHEDWVRMNLNNERRTTMTRMNLNNERRTTMTTKSHRPANLPSNARKSINAWCSEPLPKAGLQHRAKKLLSDHWLWHIQSRGAEPSTEKTYQKVLSMAQNELKAASSWVTSLLSNTFVIFDAS